LILLSASFVGWCTNFKNTHGLSNVKFIIIIYTNFSFKWRVKEFDDDDDDEDDHGDHDRNT